MTALERKVKIAAARTATSSWAIQTNPKARFDSSSSPIKNGNEPENRKQLSGPKILAFVGSWRPRCLLFSRKKHENEIIYIQNSSEGGEHPWENEWQRLSTKDSRDDNVMKRIRRTEKKGENLNPTSDGMQESLRMPQLDQRFEQAAQRENTENKTNVTPEYVSQRGMVLPVGSTWYRVKTAKIPRIETSE